MAQSAEFMFQNVAYRPTVYRTGVTRGTANKNKDMNEMFLKSHNVYLDLIELQNAPLTHSL
jgi:hypothetical protein